MSIYICVLHTQWLMCLYDVYLHVCVCVRVRERVFVCVPALNHRPATIPTRRLPVFRMECVVSERRRRISIDAKL